MTQQRELPCSSGTLRPLRDGTVSLGPEMFPNLPDDHVSDYRAGDPNSAVNGYLYQSGGKVLLVDAGGSGLMPGLGALHGALGAADVAATDVGMIFLTHIHPDHIGGLMDNGAAVFAHSELVLHADELAFWSDPNLRANLPEDFQPFFDVVQMTIAAYRDRIRTISGETEVAPGVVTVPLPGHTPGHTGLQFGGDGDSVLVWGDIVHVADLQFAVPEASILFDIDPDRAIQTRKDILARVSDTGQRIAGMHLFDSGHVTRSGSGFVFSPDGQES